MGTWARTAPHALGLGRRRHQVEYMIDFDSFEAQGNSPRHRRWRVVDGRCRPSQPPIPISATVGRA